MEKLKLGVLASTRATDLQAIIDASRQGTLNAELRVVISNKPDAFALERARSQGFKAVFVEGEGKRREEYDGEIARIMEAEGVQLVLLIGYLRWLSKSFVQKFAGRVMNVHPSLLPAFPGMDRAVHESVLAAGCKITGCTVHFVDEGQDTGPIIIQGAVPVLDDDSVESLKQRVQEAEKKCVVEAVRLFGEGRLEVRGKRVVIKQ